MTICVTTINFPNYKRLAEKTIPNKIKYCQKHGYHFVHKHSDFVGDLSLGYEKIHHLLQLSMDSNIEWIFFLGCDTLITNMNIKIENLIAAASGHHVVIMTADYFGVNADSFLVRNNKQGREWLSLIWNKRSEWNEKYPFEQGAMWQYNSYLGDAIKIIPQRMMNSYDYKEEEKQDHHKDKFGHSGGWQMGDFIVHWPGRSLKERMALYEKYSKMVKE